MNRFIYDIDNTLTFNIKNEKYINKPKSNFIDFNHVDSITGFGMSFYTARNMLSYSEDLKKIEENTIPVIESWLSKNQIPNEKIYYGKPYCGPKGIYIDDRAINIRNHKLSIETGFVNSPLYLIVILYNSEKIIEDVLLELLELSTFCCEITVLLVDNGSNDRSVNYLKKIEASFPFIKLLFLKSNLGYGGACIQGINEFKKFDNFNEHNLVISHGNNKFSIFDFVRGVAQYKFQNYVCFTDRKNRTLQEKTLSFFLHSLFYFFKRNKNMDCLGASRFIPHEYIDSVNVENAPNDFTFDMWLSLSLSNLEFKNIPVVENKYIKHKSSWNFGLISRLKMIKKYLIFIIKVKV